MLNVLVRVSVKIRGTRVARATAWCCQLIVLSLGFSASLSRTSTFGQTPADVAAEPSPADVEFFEQRVRPILADKCFKCHAADKQRGGLRLDHRSLILQGGDSGPAAAPGDVDGSHLLQAVRYRDLEMPPDGQLPAEQIETLVQWVAKGLPWTPGEVPPQAVATKPVAPADDAPHWAYQPLADVQPPRGDDMDARFRTHPIDRFIARRWADQGVSGNSPAPSLALARRLHYDLLGLPPTADDVQRFARVASEQDYEHYVDALLARPEYGEQWGRHWLDLVRYAETNGYERDGAKPNAWRYRDYVIQAFNADKAYDRFVREQLAGDELPTRDFDSLTATGYYRLGVWDDEPADAEQAFFDNLDDLVSTTGLVFLGTTMGCARCHDHKIDPIPQRDYYRLQAFFRNVYSDIRDTGTKKTAFTMNTQASLASPAQRQTHEAELRQLETRLTQMQAIIDRCEQVVYNSFSNPEKEDAADEEVRRQMIRKRARDVLSPEEWQQYDETLRELRQLKRQQVTPLPEALSMRENGRTAPPTHILIRGSAHAPGDIVEPGFPAVMTKVEPNLHAAPDDVDSSGRRTALAEWLVGQRNPLAARVIVNRVWQYHFGRGLVRTANDFGHGGDRPTHPELLDYLANELIRHDWQLKWLHRFILTSQTYRLSSADNANALTADPENHLFWRFDMRRLTAEEVRDTVLSVTGQLNLRMHGPSVFSKIPDEILQSASRPEDAWGKSAPADQVRRSVYVFVKRSIADPVLFGFDSADTDASCPVRFATTVPTQSLTSLNGAFFNEQADVFAEQLRHDGCDDTASFVATALRRATGRAPSDEEVARGRQLLDGWQTQDHVPRNDAERYFCLLVLNLNEMIYLD